jgi:phosphatidate cytidylyltransferase
MVSLNQAIMAEQDSVARQRFARYFNRNLITRFASGLILMPFVLYAIINGGTSFYILASIVLFIAALEFLMMVNQQQFRWNIPVGMAMTMIIANGIVQGWDLLWAGAIVVGGVLIVLVEVFTDPQPTRAQTLRRATLIWGISVYLAVVMGVGIRIRLNPAGLFWWLLIIAGTWGMDVFSYLGGRAYGNRPLAPRLSPKKTVEGAITGGLSAIAISLAVMAVFYVMHPVLLLLIVLTPIADLIGDLSESMLKRSLGVKDSHIPWLDVVPGHGGMLDRIDGLTTVIPVTYLLMVIFYNGVP